VGCIVAHVSISVNVRQQPWTALLHIYQSILALKKLLSVLIVHDIKRWRFGNVFAGVACWLNARLAPEVYLVRPMASV